MLNQKSKLPKKTYSTTINNQQHKPFTDESTPDASVKKCTATTNTTLRTAGSSDVRRIEGGLKIRKTRYIC